MDYWRRERNKMQRRRERKKRIADTMLSILELMIAFWLGMAWQYFRTMK